MHLKLFSDNELLDTLGVLKSTSKLASLLLETAQIQTEPKYTFLGFKSACWLGRMLAFSHRRSITMHMAIFSVCMPLTEAIEFWTWYYMYCSWNCKNAMVLKRYRAMIHFCKQSAEEKEFLWTVAFLTKAVICRELSLYPTACNESVQSLPWSGDFIVQLVCAMWYTQ